MAHAPSSPVPALTRAERIRQVANWVNLTTPLGLAVARLGRADVRRYRSGLYLAEGYRLKFPVAGAFTVGNVIVFSDDVDLLLALFPELIEHEESHTWQYAWTLGLPFFPLYALGMAWSWVRTGDRAAANFFERRAGLESGGYLPAEKRPLRDAARDLTRAVRSLRRQG